MQKFVAIMHIQNILTKLYSKQILFKIISIILSFMLDKVRKQNYTGIKTTVKYILFLDSQSKTLKSNIG